METRNPIIYKGQGQLNNGFTINLLINSDTNIIQLEQTNNFDEIVLKQLTNVSFSNQQITHLNGTTLDEFENLKEINFSFNELKVIDSNLLSKLENLEKIELNSNQIFSLNPILFSRCVNLRKINISNNNLYSLPHDIFPNSLGNLGEINFSANKITDLEANVFSNLKNLKEIDFSSNRLSYLDSALFQGLSNLTKISFASNQLTCLDARIFEQSKNLKYINFSDNKITEISADLFKSNRKLKEIDFSHNQIIQLSPRIFYELSGLKKVNFMYDFENTSRIVFWDSEKLFDEFFSYDSNASSESNSRLSEVYIGYLIMLFLSKRELIIGTSFTRASDIFDLKKYLYNHADYSSYLDIQPLDFLLRLVRIPNKVIIRLIDKVDSFIGARKTSSNVFSVSLIKSVLSLCKRDGRYIEELMDKLCSTERDHFEIDDFSECFKIVLEKQKETIAICLFHIFWTKLEARLSRNGETMETLVELKFFFNCYLESCYRLKWWRFLKELLTLFQTSNQKMKDVFLLMFEYNLIKKHVQGSSSKELPTVSRQLSSDPDTKYEWALVKNKSNNRHLLHYISQSKQQSLIKHPTTKDFLYKKWRNLPFYVYHFHLIIYIVFVVFYTINLESVRNNSLVELNDFSQQISLVIVIFFCVEELFQLFVLRLAYFKDILNLFEFVNYPLCTANLVIVFNGSAKAPLYVITIILTYAILILRFEKFKYLRIGIYMTVFKKIITRSIGIVPLVMLTLLGFVFAFRATTPQVLLDSNNVSQGYLYSGTFWFDLVRIITMGLSEFSTSQMGLGLNLNSYTYINYVIYAVFIYIIPMTVINMFLGITVDEIGNLIDDSENHNTVIRIDYVLKLQELLINLEQLFKRLERIVKVKILYRFGLVRRFVKWSIVADMSKSRRSGILESIIAILKLVVRVIKWVFRRRSIDVEADSSDEQMIQSVSSLDVVSNMTQDDRIGQLEERINEILQDNEYLSSQLDHSIRKQAELEAALRDVKVVPILEQFQTIQNQTKVYFDLLLERINSLEEKLDKHKRNRRSSRNDDQ